MKIRLTRKFRFEMAHALMNYDGACRNIHGHSYQLAVTVSGEPREAEGHPKDGMVMDFGDLKRMVQEEVIEGWDHALLLNARTDAGLVAQMKAHHERVVLVGYQPTSENMLADIVGRLQKRMPAGIRLEQVLLRETENSHAEWHAADQA